MKSTPPVARPPLQREEIRRRFLRANTAVAILLAILLALAVTAVFQSFRSASSLRRAEQAEQDGREKLWHSLLAQARAVRLSEQMGRRAQGLEAIKAATLIRPGRELRDEAIACLALTDLEETGQSWNFPEGVGTVAYDPVNERFAAGLPNGDVSVRALTNHAELFLLPRQTNNVGPDIISHLAFSQDGRLLEVRYWRSSVFVWDLSERRILWRGLVDQSKSPPSIAPIISDDDRWIYHYNRYRESRLVIYDRATLREEPVRHPPQEGNYASIQPGRKVVALVNGSELNLWDWERGESVRLLKHPARIRRVAFDREGGRLAVACYNSDVFIWNLDTGEYQLLSGHTAVAWHLAFSPDGALLMTVAYDETTRLWDVNLGRVLVTTSQGYGLGFSTDGSRIATAIENRRLGQWRVIRGDGYRAYHGEGPRDAAVWQMDLSRTNHLLAMLTGDHLNLWSLVAPGAEFHLQLPDTRSLVLQPDGMGIFLCRSNGLEWRVVARANTAGQAVLRLGEPQVIPLPANARPYRAGISADGRWLVVETEEHGGYVLAVADPARAVKLEGHLTFRMTRPAATATGGGMMAVSSDGRWVASGYGGGTGPRVFDARTGKLARDFGKASAHVSFSPDSRWLTLATAGNLKMLEAADWKPLWEKNRSAHSSRQGLVAFAEDSRTLAFDSDRKFVQLFNAADGDAFAAFIGPHAQTAHSIRYTSENGFLAIGTANNFVQVWDLSRIREQLRQLGLDWTPATAASAALATKSPAPPSLARSPAGAIALSLACVSLAAVLALLSLRRHRNLIEDFARSEDLVAQRERALHVEREVNALKSSFVSLVSHEFRTPLGVIVSSTQLLDKYFARLSEAERTEQLAEIQESADRMKDLIEEVLLLGKVESGRMECHPAPVNLRSLCDRAIADVARAAPSGCRIELQLNGAPTEAWLDEKLALIVLTNLLGNGVKYSRPGEPVTLKLAQRAPGLAFEISDRGIGIPVADQAKLFTAFHRGANVAGISGTGLGLTIVKRCVDLHGGTISFTSAENQGTTFTVQFPSG